MQCRVVVTAAVCVLSLAPLGGCGSDGSRAPAGATDAALRLDIGRGMAQLRRDEGALLMRGRIAGTVARLRRDTGETTAGRRARQLAIAGFTWTLRSFDAQRHMMTSDSGNLPASVRDAERGDRYRERGARLLQAALTALGS
jgi:hypothetical protein